MCAYSPVEVRGQHAGLSSGQNHVAPRDQTQVSRLGHRNHLYPLSHLSGQLMQYSLIKDI